MRKIIILSGCVIKELLRRKDFYLIFVLLIVMIIYAGLISFGGEHGFQRYFKEIGISLAYMFSVIIAVTFASRQVAQEVESKIIYPILARPVSRAEFLIGKFAGVLLISVISFTLFYAVFIISSVSRGDFSSPPGLLLEGYLLHIFLLSFFTSLTILLSLFLSNAANVGLVFIIYLATNWFGATLPGYIYLPHPELFDIKEKIVHTWDLVPGWVILFLGAYAAIYTSIFLFSAYLVFKTRDL
jgi:ABC-type transport system involved in multi-copper enzyme maturation permease subunit